MLIPCFKLNHKSQWQLYKILGKLNQNNPISNKDSFVLCGTKENYI